jgi:excisionase family DNA binding protein
MDSDIVQLNSRSPRMQSSVRRVDLDSLPLLLAVPEASRLLGISRSAGYRLAESGELPIRRLGGRIYVITSRLLDMVEAA